MSLAVGARGQPRYRGFVSNVEFIATGAELLIGRTVNTHAQRLAHAFRPLGLELIRETTVRDDRAAIADAVRDALGRADIVVVSGGLGPTCDDLTREALSDALGRALRSDASTLARLEERYARLQQTLTEARRRQAEVLDGAIVLANPVGAAPGQRIELDGDRVVFVLPGPPHEFQAILDQHIVPWLSARFGGPLPERVWMVCGLVEADAIERFRSAGFDPGPLELAYCASPGQLEVRLSGPRGREAELAAAAAQVRAILGADAYAERREDLAATVGALLRERDETVGTAESCTGGLLAQRLTAIPGCSAWFRGAVVAYANDLKSSWLDVPAEVLARHGAVSEATALAMADGARRRIGVDHAIAVTGIAGPDGGTPEKPVGLVWWAHAGARGAVARSRRFSGGREIVRQWAAQYALDLLRRRLLGVA